MSFDAIKKVKVGDLDIAFREEGSGEPIVLIHGWPLSSLTWRKVVPGLSGERRCIAPDLLGVGESTCDPARDHSLATQAKLVEGFMDALGIEKATVIGHNSGGSIARNLAVANPERVSRLILANTEVPGHKPFFVRFLKGIARLPGSLAIIRMNFTSKALAKSPLGFGLCFSGLKSFDFDEFYQTLVAPNARSDASIRSTRKFLLDFDFDDVDACEARYGELKMPKYLIWGEDDKIFPLEQGWRLRDMLPEPTRFDMISGAGLFVLRRELTLEENMRFTCDLHGLRYCESATKIDELLETIPDPHS